MTTEAIRDGWSRAGDPGPADAAGFITLVDRKDMIITGGETYTLGLIAHFKCPIWVEFVGTLPRKATGKLLKRSLRKQFPCTTTAASR